MRIGYNCRFLQGPLTGVQRIAEDLLAALVAVDRTNTYVAFLCGRGGRHVAALEAPNVEVVGADRDVPGRLRRQAWEQETLPRLARAAGLDVMHHPANTAPRRGLERALVSIYDTSFLAHPEWFSRQFHWYYRWLIPRVARGAARLVTSSEFSKGELVRHLGVDPGRVEVVYPGVSRSFLEAGAVVRLPSPKREPFRGSAGEECASSDAHAAEPAQVGHREQFASEDADSSAPASDGSPYPGADVPREFVLFVGGTNPRKNLAGLVAATRLLWQEPTFAYVGLTVVGGSADIFRQVPAPSSAGGGKEPIQFLSTVSEEALVGLYRRAACLCYPSFYEGFGLPPLEALAVGTPVVAADIPVLREVLAEAALFADPADPAALAGALARVLGDRGLRADLIRKGAERVQRFTYEAAARRTLEIYEEVARA